VDLAELDSMSSEALGVLLDQSRTQELSGGWLRVVSPSEAADMILRLSGVVDVLGVFPDAETALADAPSRAA
jgi:anti-anti-sigma factor